MVYQTDKIYKIRIGVANYLLRIYYLNEYGHAIMDCVCTFDNGVVNSFRADLLHRDYLKQLKEVYQSVG